MKTAGKVWKRASIFVIIPILVATLLLFGCTTINVSSVALDKSELALSIGESQTLTATITVSPDEEKYKDVVWSTSNKDIAKVSSNGVVEGIGAGNAIITAKSKRDKGKSATCTVIVVRATVESVNLSQTAVNMKAGEVYKVIATVAATPDTDNNKKVKWSSENKAIASVSDTGEITAVSTGDTVITATSQTDPEKSAQCGVTVEKAEITIVLDQTTLELITGSAGQLQAIVAAVPETPENKEVTWKSSDRAIAEVSADGLVSGFGGGTAIITATSKVDTGKSADCTVNVTHIASVELDFTEVLLASGGTQSLRADVTVMPETGNKAVNWTSSNDAVVTVDAEGNVTAVSDGTATITATSDADPSKKADCFVTVETPVIDSVGLNKTTLTLATDGEEALSAIVVVNYPRETYKKVIWTSSDPSIASVDENGLVQAHATGEVVITATSVVDDTQSAACTVTVT